MANNKDFILKNPVVIGGPTNVTLGTVTGNNVDLSTGNYFKDTPSGNSTYSISNAGGVQSFQLEVTGSSEEVLNNFSTTLYNGTGLGRQIENNINLGNSLNGPYTYFDHTSGGRGGYLYRNSDLSSNADGKTFTFSAWIRSDESSNFIMYRIQTAQDTGVRFYATLSGAVFKIAGYNSGGAVVLDTGWQTIVIGEWFHILVSVDLASTSNRYMYKDDVELLGPSSSWTTYTNDNIDFTNAHHYVQAYRSSADNGVQGKGGIAKVFLDYTYRDLSTTSNRRTFINANITPVSNSTLSALNPILYLPLDYTNSTGTNLGTGGDLVAYNSDYYKAKEKGGPGIGSGGEGGLVWTKWRSGALGSAPHVLVDTERGVTRNLRTNTTGAETTEASINSFNSTGYTLATGSGPNGGMNYSGTANVSWTFKKKAKFFDIQTWVGNGTSSRSISHNLGVIPGMIIVKWYNESSESWVVYHRGFNDGTDPEDYGAYLQSTMVPINEASFWYDTAPTSTNFTIGNNLNSTYGGGGQYIAYIFAHETSADSMIKCGTYTKTGSSQDIDLGWTPSWLMLKRVSSVGSWYIMDTERGFSTSATPVILKAESTDGEGGLGNVKRTSTGFNVTSNAGEKWVYMAIRAAGDPAITWPSSIEWAGGLAPSAPTVGETDVFTIATDDGGTTYTGVKTADNLS